MVAHRLRDSLFENDLGGAPAEHLGAKVYLQGYKSVPISVLNRLSFQTALRRFLPTNKKPEFDYLDLRLQSS